MVSAIRQLPFSRLVNPCAPIEVLSADHVKAIIYAALTILETRGMRFLEGAAAGYCARAERNPTRRPG